MNKQLCFTALLILSVILSVSVVCASDVNVTDSYATSLVDDTKDVSVYNENVAGSEILASSVSNVDDDSSKVSLSSEEVLESDNSNALSTNTDLNKNNNAGSDASGSKLSASSSSRPVSVSISDIVFGANKLNTYYAAHYSLPNTVRIADYQFTMPEFFYLMSQAISQLGNSNGKQIKCVYGIKEAPSPGGEIINANLKKEDYLTVAKNCVNFLNNNGRAPNYVSSSLGHIGFNQLFDAFSRTISYYGDNKALPGSLAIVNRVNSVSIQDIIGGATKLKTYYAAYNSLPSTVRVADYPFTMPEFLYLMNKAISQLGNSNAKPIKCVYGLKEAPSPAGNVINSNLQKADYLTVSKNCANFFDKNGRAPNYLSSSLGKIGFNEFFDASSRVLAFYGENKRLPNYVAIITKPTSLTIYEIKTAANKLKTYYATHHSLPSTVRIADCPFTMPEFLYLMSHAIYQLGHSNTGSVKCVYGLKAAPSPGETVVNGDLKKTDYLAVAKKCIDFFDKNGRAPNFVSSSLGNIGFNELGDGFARILTSEDGYVLPVSVVINPKSSIAGTAYGYFVFGGDMKKVDLNYLASTGTTDLFLNYYALEKHGRSAVESWIASANRLGMRVHIWMQAFYDGSWINPVSNGKYNTALFNELIDEAKYYANLKGISGILFDYLRYPGTAYKTNGGSAAITKFTQMITEAIHNVNPSLIVSAAIMPETTASNYYYGQDYPELTRYLDVVLPMIYKGNYGKSTSWIKQTAKWYADNSQGAQVWTILQAYRSDNDVTKLSTSELTNDIRNALSGGSDGVIMFRYGLTNFPNFNNI